MIKRLLAFLLLSSEVPSAPDNVGCARCDARCGGPARSANPAVEPRPRGRASCSWGLRFRAEAGIGSGQSRPAFVRDRSWVTFHDSLSTSTTSRRSAISQRRKECYQLKRAARGIVVDPVRKSWSSTAKHFPCWFDAYYLLFNPKKLRLTTWTG
jgi:hypothetical protein